MATHDYVIANGTGAAVRSDLNNALAAIVSNNSSATEPTTTYAYMWWADTTAGQLKLRNAADNAWVTIQELDGTMLMEDGTVGAPGLAFASDLDTGFFRPAADQLGIATNGVERVEFGTTEVVFNDGGANIDFRIEGDTEANLFFVDASTDRVGINTTSPTELLSVNGNIWLGNGGGSGGSEMLRIWNDSGVERIHASNNPSALAFGIGGSSSTFERARIDSSGRLLVGTSSSPSVGAGQYSLLKVQGYAGVAAGTGDISISRGQAASSGFSAEAGIGIINFTDSEGYAFGQIYCAADGTTAANDYPGYMSFYTTADGASSGTERMKIGSDGNTSFRNCTDVYPVTDNAVRLGANGVRWSQVWAANGTIQTSDQRAKADITDAQLGSEFIKSLRPVSYKWIEGGKVDSGKRDDKGNYIYESVPGARTHWGFIAQEVKQVIDDAGVDFGGWVLTDKDDPDSQQALRYDQFIAPLTKALQEALAKIETLEQRLSDAGIA